MALVEEHHFLADGHAWHNRHVDVEQQQTHGLEWGHALTQGDSLLSVLVEHLLELVEYLASVTEHLKPVFEADVLEIQANTLLVHELVVSHEDFAVLVWCQESLWVFVQKLDESSQVVVLLGTLLVDSDVVVRTVQQVNMHEITLKLDCVVVGGSLNDYLTTLSGCRV